MKHKNLILLHILLLSTVYLFCGGLSIALAETYSGCSGDFNSFTIVWVKFIKLFHVIYKTMFGRFLWLMPYVTIVFLVTKHIKGKEDRYIDAINLILSVLFIILLVTIYAPLAMFISQIT